MKSPLIIGCGYIGKILGKALLQKSSVTAIVRSEASLQACSHIGIEAMIYDLDIASDSLDLADRVICYLVPPPPQGDKDTRIERFLTLINAQNKPARIVLISTTGVYGDCHGGWIDETQPTNPQADRAKRRLDAEQQLISNAKKFHYDYVILRVPGIYGPGKLPLARLKKGSPVLAEAISPWSNRVHACDLVRTCIAACTTEHTNQVFNITDGHPSTMTDYFNQVAEISGLPKPPEISMEEAQTQLSEGMQSYLAESKRISNQKMREVLGVIPDFADLQSGLRQCIEEDQDR